MEWDSQLEGKQVSIDALDMVKILSSQPDFVNEKPHLQDRMETRGYILLISPKCHRMSWNWDRICSGIANNHFKKTFVKIIGKSREEFPFLRCCNPGKSLERWDKARNEMTLIGIIFYWIMGEIWQIVKSNPSENNWKNIEVIGMLFDLDREL